jgi:uncharacterized lipoprotein
VQRRLIGILAAAAGAALLAGCGGSSRLSKTQYEQHIQRDGRDAQAAVVRAQGSITSPADLPKELAVATNAVKAAADDLDSIKPPKDADADNHTIVVGLRTIQAELEKLRVAANKHDISALRSAAAALQGSPEIRAAQQAANDLKKKGYKIGVIGEAG